MDIQKLTERLNYLIGIGEKVLATRRSAPSMSPRTYWGETITPASEHRFPSSNDLVEDLLFRQWRTSSLSFLKMLPSDWVYYQQFDLHCEKAVFVATENGIAILKAAKDDINSGSLQKIETLVSADIFTNFLEMTEHLLSNNYKDASASLIGAVLEDSLRKICVNNDRTVKKDDDISALNQKLAQKGVYNSIQQKQIQVWNDIRNKADHGQFDQYKIEDVNNMLSGVSNFLANYLK